MPTNKNALLRYQILDRCFSDFTRKYEIDDLVDKVNDALYDLYGTEVSIRQIRDAAMNHEGKDAEEREDKPYCCHQQIGITTTQRVVGISTQEKKQESAPEGYQQRHQKRNLVVLVKVEGHDCTPGHEECLNEQQRPDDLADDTEVNHFEL